LTLGRLPGIDDWRAHAILLPLAFIGGISVPVVMNLADTLFRRGALSRHTLTVLSLSAGLYLAGFILLLPGTSSVDGTNRVVVASAMSLDARSAGFPFVAIGSFSRAAQWMLIVMMLIGAAPGGRGGGV